ncbi:MAG TPA: hypothetical protein DDW52_15770 [Planctomycetaceae bacterium]|nr:hypothetical protein [Planctomycetaceae bacterium]
MGGDVPVNIDYCRRFPPAALISIADSKRAKRWQAKHRFAKTSIFLPIIFLPMTLNRPTRLGLPPSAEQNAQQRKRSHAITTAHFA